jgi:hypothetical protein
MARADITSVSASFGNHGPAPRRQIAAKSRAASHCLAGRWLFQLTVGAVMQVFGETILMGYEQV